MVERQQDQSATKSKNKYPLIPIYILALSFLIISIYYSSGDRMWLSQAFIKTVYTNDSTIHNSDNTLYSAYMIAAIDPYIKFSKTSNCFSRMNFTNNTKIYLITNTDSDQIFKKLHPHQLNQINVLYINESINNRKRINIEMYFNVVLKYVFDFKNSKIISEDKILWYFCDSLIPKIYTINMSSGSNDWIRYKAMNQHSWALYRLGDMFKSHALRYFPDNSGYPYHKHHFPDSIAVQYMELINQTGTETETESSIPLMIKAMEGRDQLYPSNNTLVIHLRIGDVIEHIHYKDTDLMHYEILYDPISVFEKWKTNFTSYNISKVVFVTGFHTAFNHTNSIEYIMKVRDWFESNNFDVSFRINESPDADFMFMCNSKYFMQTIRGFSELIAVIVTIRNGTVFNAGRFV